MAVTNILTFLGKENQQTEMTDNSGEPLDDPKNIGRANSKTDKSPQNREEVCVTTEPPASSASKREDETVGKAVAAIVGNKERIFKYVNLGKRIIYLNCMFY